MDNEELRQMIESLRGHARWIRNHRTRPDKYHDPSLTVPNELERMADRLATLNQQFQHKEG